MLPAIAVAALAPVNEAFAALTVGAALTLAFAKARTGAAWWCCPFLAWASLGIRRILLLGVGRDSRLADS